MKIRVFEAFAGYGSQSLALERLRRNYPQFDYEVVGYSEIDKAAIKSYNALHPNVTNYGDISAIDWTIVPDFDLFTYSSPCTDFSVAGNMAGGEEGSGTRSSLLWECKRAIEIKRPTWLLFENVPSIVNNVFKHTFHRWQLTLESYGYSNYAKILNALDYGVPQNRRRVFMISTLNGQKFNFPKSLKERKTLDDILQDEVDESYCLNDSTLRQIQQKLKTQ